MVEPAESGRANLPVSRIPIDDKILRLRIMNSEVDGWARGVRQGEPPVSRIPIDEKILRVYVIVG